METKVFLIDEQKETIFDSEKNQEWLNLVKELGLETQEKLICQDGKVLSPVPFPALIEAEREIFSKVFNSQVDFRQYRSEAIPLPCLSSIALCEREKYFHKIEIWSSEQMADPLVIGVIFDDPAEALKSWSFASRKYYKIAQWGAKLKSLIELLPLYDEFMRQSIESNRQTSLHYHESQMKKFEFEINSFQE